VIKSSIELGVKKMSGKYSKKERRDIEIKAWWTIANAFSTPFPERNIFQKYIAHKGICFAIDELGVPVCVQNTMYKKVDNESFGKYFTFDDIIILREYSTDFNHLLSFSIINAINIADMYRALWCFSEYYRMGGKFINF